MGFRDCVCNAWGQSARGNPFHVLVDKLKKTKKALVALNSTVGNLSTAVNTASADLHHTQTLLQITPLDRDLIEQEKRCLHNLWTVLDREESLLQ